MNELANAQSNKKEVVSMAQGQAGDATKRFEVVLAVEHQFMRAEDEDIIIVRYTYGTYLVSGTNPREAVQRAAETFTFPNNEVPEVDGASYVGTEYAVKVFIGRNDR